MAKQLQEVIKNEGADEGLGDQTELLYKIADIVGERAVKDYEQRSLQGYVSLSTIPQLVKPLAISNVNLKWSPERKAFYSEGKIGVSHGSSCAGVRSTSCRAINAVPVASGPVGCRRLLSRQGSPDSEPSRYLNDCRRVLLYRERLSVGRRCQPAAQQHPLAFRQRVLPAPLQSSGPVAEHHPPFAPHTAPGMPPSHQSPAAAA